MKHPTIKTASEKVLYTHYIGIDTGTNTGIAIWHKPAKRLIMIETMKIHEAMAIVKDYILEHQTFVRVEDARQVKFKTDAVKAQGAGSVKRDASIWDDYLKSLNANYLMVRPVKALTKVKSEYFKQLTGVKEATNSHGRDAAMMVFGS